MGAVEIQSTPQASKADKMWGARIVVGGDARGVILDRFTASVPPGSDITVVTVASEDGEGTFRDCERAFRRRQFQEAVHHIDRNTTPKDARVKLRSTGGVWLSGGDQEPLLSYMQLIEIDSEVPRLNREGAAYGANSAGAAISGERTIVPVDKNEKKASKNIQLLPGIIMVEEVIFDQHFTERERLVRLVEASKRTGFVGIGIDEATATIIDPEGEVEVVGRGGVTVVIPSNGREYDPVHIPSGKKFKLSDYTRYNHPHTIFEAQLVA